MLRDNRTCDRDVGIDVSQQPDEVLVRMDRRLPNAIRAMKCAPFGLHVRGSTDVLRGRPRAAIVGSRHPTGASLQTARTMAAELARHGVVVVSGLAIGVDGAAHRGALDVQGETIAVLGGGIDRVHPSQHRALAKQIASSGGALVSEYAPNSASYPQRFRDRNRLIAAFADVVVVVQARINSGSMITTNLASDLGIDMMVVPGAIGDPNFSGSTQLLRDGARVAVDANSVLRYLGIDNQPDNRPEPFDGLLAVPRSPDELAAFTGLEIDDITLQLLDLQLDGQVRSSEDGRYVATSR
jgi:DNA processing protein